MVSNSVVHNESSEQGFPNKKTSADCKRLPEVHLVHRQRLNGF